MGIEPTYPAWKAGVLPLNYTRVDQPELHWNTNTGLTVLATVFYDPTVIKDQKEAIYWQVERLGGKCRNRTCAPHNGERFSKPPQYLYA